MGALLQLLFQRGGFQNRVEFFICYVNQIGHPGEGGRIAAWLAVCALGHMVGQLGQGLGGTDANATGNAGPHQDAVPDQLGLFGQVALDTGEFDEALFWGLPSVRMAVSSFLSLGDE